MKKWIWITMILICAFVFAACADEKDDSVTETEGTSDGDMNDENTTGSTEVDVVEDDKLPFVTVNLMDGNGKPVGTVELTEEEDALRVMVDAKDLPEGLHGFHFHEKGVCEAPDFESAGGHFNPTEASHGLDHEGGSHAGDLPNLEVGPDGTAKEEFFVENLTLLAGEENSLFHEGSTAVVIHAEADDGKTQPSGNSGDRIACGVVE
ncbi:superoxide dismutase family protein [Sporosarcina koreensis]|uniref:superoxide dismutase family protein n=1 Tax=Bacillales TaxID=1385 RepID=UPI00075B331C|nr:superoxide dismutase family protein [Sporosarcina koreensis]